MKESSFSKIIFIFIIMFLILSVVYYEKTKQLAVKNAEIKIEEFLLNYKAFRSYVSNEQKEEIYRLQKLGKLSTDYFHPTLLSSTYSARHVNDIYNEYRKNDGLMPIEIRFASDNPRNPLNKATAEESKLLKQFNDNEIDRYAKIISTKNGQSLYYVLPTKKTTQECMKCHSDPKLAPKGLLSLYGDKNGFYEEVGKIRAILSTTYPLDKDLEEAHDTFMLLSSVTFFVFNIILLLVYFFIKQMNKARDTLLKLNKKLDEKVNRRTLELEKEKHHIKKVLDNSAGLIIITDGKNIKDANQQFLDFFHFKSLKDFKNEHHCICDYFVEIDDMSLLKCGKIDGLNWVEYIVSDVDKINLLKLKNDESIYYFNVQGIYFEDYSNDILVTLQDVTELKQQENVVIQQSKMASLGEMLDNIAHQWRQPLSVISTIASGLVAKKEYGMLDDKELINSLCNVEQTTQYLSHTIEDFRNFFKEDKEKKNFKISKILDYCNNLVSSDMKLNHIQINTEVEDFNLFTFENELTQVILNILNNAKDAFNGKIQDHKIITIKTEVINNSGRIIIQDNAGGISEDIITKIYEPYFTTKHKANGTGIGLYMAYEIIKKHIGGKIEAKNEAFVIDGQDYKGARFIITLPLI